MPTKINKLSVGRLCKMIEEMQDIKFDCIVIIEGNRGLGKSTLAWHICNRTKKYHTFNPEKDIVFTRKQVINFFNNYWKSTGWADEMINVSFNRDFYNEDQKRLIKIMNMNRDHCNLFVACVPQFQTLDNQLKNMCKIRLTVLRRGLAIVQTQNRAIYSTDRWDTKENEKVEKKWLKGGNWKPRYSQLSTFRAILTFPDLTPKQREIYERIKIEKRNEIKAQEESEAREGDPHNRLYSLLDQGSITSKSQFDNLCFMYGLKPLNAMQNIRNRMRNSGDYRKFMQFFVDDYQKIGDHGVVRS